MTHNFTIRLLSSQADLASYDAWVRSHPEGSLWQSLAWKTYQEALGREVRIYACFVRHGEHVMVSLPNHESMTSPIRQAQGDVLAASALVVIDRTAFGMSTWEMPRGPIGVMSHESLVMSLLDKIQTDAIHEHCMAMYLSPLVPLKTQDSRLKTSPRHLHPEATRMIDLTVAEEEILKHMHQKGRYNIKVAMRHGVTVRQGTADDIDAFYELLSKTSRRDGFAISPQAHYETFLTHLEGSFLLLAYTNEVMRHESRVMSDTRLLKTQDSRLKTHRFPIAALLGVTFHDTGIYYYGASDHVARTLMAPYLLQWEAMKLCKAKGCTTYDLLGIAPTSTQSQTHDSRLMTHDSSHPWSGVSAFKEKFGGTVVTYPPEREIVLRPWAKRMLQWKRKMMG